MKFKWLLTLTLVSISEAQSKLRFKILGWIKNVISTDNLFVSVKSNLVWSFQAPRQINKGDCIAFEIKSPFSGNQGITNHYKAFSKLGEIPCSIDNGVTVTCSAVSQQGFQIYFNQTVNARTILNGRTSGNPFQNPYSARQIPQFEVNVLPQCNQNSQPTVSGKTLSYIQYNPGTLSSSSVKLTSSSNVVGDRDDVKLEVYLKPTSTMPAVGNILVQTPNWYQIQTTQSGPTSQMSSSCMLDFNSQVKILSADPQLKIQSTQFQQTGCFLQISYNFPSDGWTFPVQLQVSGFKNPINHAPKFGFSVSTTDSRNINVDTTKDSMTISNKMGPSQPLELQSLSFLGNDQGQNVGQVGFINGFQLQMVSPIPMEPNCFVQIQMPPQLELQKISKISGTGFFSNGRDQFMTDLYEVDYTKNILTVQACLRPQDMSENPSGILSVYSVRLPPYVTSSSPIQIKIFSNSFMNDVVVDAPRGPALDPNQMTPGEITLLKFQPSNQFAFSLRNSFLISIIPQSGIPANASMVIQMPKRLSFAPQCRVEQLQGDCRIDTETNVIALKGITTSAIQAGSSVSFTIFQADNPSAAVPVGNWSITTIVNDKDEQFVQDYGFFEASFTALPGWIKSTLDYSNKITYSQDTQYSFVSKPQHSIPTGGFIKIILPDDCGIGQKISATGLIVSSFDNTTNSILLSISKGSEKEQPISFQVQGIRNPRSLEPSKVFVIQTLNSDMEPVDEGKDVLAIMTTLANFVSLSITPQNLTNGKTGNYSVLMNSYVQIKNEDTLIFTLPSQMSVIQGKIPCWADAQTKDNSLIQVLCQGSGQEVQAQFSKISNDFGDFNIIINGIQNPPSFRNSDLISDVYLVTKSNYNIQTVKSYESLFVKNNRVANITDYVQTQTNQQYGEDSDLKITFMPINALNPNSVITLTWPTQVYFYKDTDCIVQTTKVQTSPTACVFKDNSVIISGIFNKIYSGQIQISFDKVRNPVTNKNMLPFIITTYDDQSRQYPQDIVWFYSLLECYYTCRSCSQNKNYCTQCWPGDENFVLMQLGTTSNCQPKCNFGWTTNGDKKLDTKLCVPCDVSCNGCQDNGIVGDYMNCLSCNPGFNFQDEKTGQCYVNCPIGTYDMGNGKCGKCDSSCLECSKSPTNCLSCNQSSTLPALLGSYCVDKCPTDHTNKGGVCLKCQSPCSTCSGDPLSCSSCDGSLGRIFNYGSQCREECPQGTQQDLMAKVCLGCQTGCSVCNETDISQCLVCTSMLLFQGQCIQSCPEGWEANFAKTECLQKAALDLAIVYFPILIITVITFATSFIGHKLKPRHDLLSNFIAMMGIIEYLALIAQIALCFAQASSPAFGVVSIVIWLVYVGASVAFWWMFDRTMKDDELLKKWLLSKKNRMWMKVIQIIGFLSWKSYKFLYSHFFGLKIQTTDFRKQKDFELLMKKFTLINVFGVYIPVIGLNIAGLTMLGQWGNQLFILYIENILIATIMGGVGVYEQLKLGKYLNAEFTRRDQYQQKMNPIKVFGRYEEDEEQEHKAQLIGKISTKTNFLAQTLDQLINQFGNKKCKSMVELHPSALDRRRFFIYQMTQLEKDPRQTKSYPMSPNTEINVDRPPKPLGPLQPNNCYAEPKDKELLTMINPLDGKGRNKAIQVGGPFADDLKRVDAQLISKQDPDDESQYRSGQKKQRGRKNRYFTQIDQEDHKAGAILDSDDEGETANRKARNDHLAAVQEEVKPPIDDNLRAEIERNLEQQRIKAKIEEVQLQDKKNAADFKAKIDATERNLKAQMVTDDRESPQKEILNKVSSLSNKIAPEPPNRNVDVKLPNAQNRTFNEAQIIGEFNRTTDGQVIVIEIGEYQYRDNLQRLVTQQGYVLNAKGEIISNIKPGFVMFNKMVEDELPAPFCVERYNFSPWEILGKVKYKNLNDPMSFDLALSGGKKVDLNFQRVNDHGFLLDEIGNIIKFNGEKVLFKEQLLNGEIPPLYTYGAKTFDISEVMGVFDVQEGKPKFVRSTEGGKTILKDQSGHLVNERGYLVSKEGHICNRSGKVLFHKDHLKSGDFPKFFSFTKFNKKMFLGDFKYDNKGSPILTRDKYGKFQDRIRRTVNPQGYLLDVHGNIIDRAGNLMFDKNLLDNQGQLPELFRGGYIIMTMAEQIKESQGEDDQAYEQKRQKSPSKVVQKIENPNETSYGSQMEDSPAKYDMENQRIVQSIDSFRGGIANTIQEVQSHAASGDVSKRKKKKRQKRKGEGMVQIKQFYEQDILMADAYGGVAQPRVRMVPKRFASVHREKIGYVRAPQLQNLTNSQHAMYVTYTAKNGGQDSTKNNPTSANDDITNPTKSIVKSRNPDEKVDPMREAHTAGALYQQNFDDEFEKLYKKDIDQFMEGSNFEVDSLSGFSELSGAELSMVDANRAKAKKLEKQYLAKLEEQKEQLQKVRGNTRGGEHRSRQ